MTQNIKNNKTVFRNKKVSILYLMPLFVFILNQGVNLTAFNIRSSSSELAFQDNPNQLIIRGFLYIVSLFLFFINFRVNTNLLKQKILFLAFALYFISSASWSSFPLKVLINWGHLWGMVFCILAARIYFKANRNRLFPFFSNTFSLLVIASIITVVFFPAIGIAEEYNGRWQGIAGNPNSFGIIAISSIWATLGVLFIDKSHKWYYRLLLIISVVGLLGCGSKTAAMVCLIMYLSMLVFVSLEKVNIAKKIFIICSLGFLVAMVFIIILLVMPQLLGIDGAANALGRDATFSGRTALWAYAWKLFQLKAIFGWGFDSNMSALQYMGGEYGQFHSGYFDLLVRGGSIGVSLAGLYILSIVSLMLNAAEIEKREAMLYLSLVVAILIHNITEATLFRGTNLFWLLVVFSYFFFDKKKGHLV